MRIGFDTAWVGMMQATRRLNTVAQEAADPARSLNRLSQQAVERTVAGNTYKANAAVARTADEMVGTLLDLKA